MGAELRRRKILVPIFYRAHLGRLRSVLTAIESHPSLELQVMTALPAAYGSFLQNLRHSEPRSWSAALPWYLKGRLAALANRVRSENAWQRDPLERKIAEEGIRVHARVPLFLDGGLPTTMAKSVGLGLVRITEELARLEPDLVFVNADRFEMMAVAIAAAYLNIPIAHNEAGDVSGTIDESVRHAITKFAQMHFVATDASRARVIQMGEDPRFVFTVGSPAIDSLHGPWKLEPVADLLPNFDPSLPYLLVMIHPVTTEDQVQNHRMVTEVLVALEALRMPTVLIYGNSDANSRVVGPEIAAWVARSPLRYLQAVKALHPDNYNRILAQAACAVGNSSSFIREGAYLGTPAVLVGSRQQGRERGQNAVTVPADATAVAHAVREQLRHGRYQPDTRFGDGRAGKRIAEILVTATPPIQKKFIDLPLPYGST